MKLRVTKVKVNDKLGSIFGYSNKSNKSINILSVVKSTENDDKN